MDESSRFNALFSWLIWFVDPTCIITNFYRYAGVELYICISLVSFVLFNFLNSLFLVISLLWKFYMHSEHAYAHLFSYIISLTERSTLVRVPLKGWPDWVGPDWKDNNMLISMFVPVGLNLKICKHNHVQIFASPYDIFIILNALYF